MSSRGAGPGAQSRAVYAAGLVQGIVLVTFPAASTGERPRREVPERRLIRMRAPGESARGQNLSGRVLEPPGGGAVQRAAPEGPRDGEVVRHAAHLQSDTWAGTL